LHSHDRTFRVLGNIAGRWAEAIGGVLLIGIGGVTFLSI